MVPLFSTKHVKGNTVSFSRIKTGQKRVTDKIWAENPSMSEIIGRCGWDEKTMIMQNGQSRTQKQRGKDFLS